MISKTPELGGIEGDFGKASDTQTIHNASMARAFALGKDRSRGFASFNLLFVAEWLLPRSNLHRMSL